MSTDPEVGAASRFTMRSRVVLPEPDSPSSTVMAPAAAVRLRWSTARVPSGKVLLTPRNSMAGDPPSPVRVGSVMSRH